MIAAGNGVVFNPHPNAICTSNYAVDLVNRASAAAGGPGVVKAVLSSGKKTIGAGAGNPPVIVDDTADIKKAGKDIIDGCTFDNNLPCIAEKEVFAFRNIADELIREMQKNAPSYAGIGFGGEGHTTFTIAGPTGEGITSARSFTRKRRCVMADSFRII